MSDDIKKMNDERIRAETSQMFDALIGDGSTVINRFPERLFVDVFLPVFSGRSPLGNESDILSQWVTVAGSPMAEVSIIDNAGNELYRVPPLHDTDSLNVVGRELGNTMNFIYDGYTMRRSFIPTVAETYLSEAIDDKSKTIIQASSRSAEYQARWRDIFNRYGIHPIIDTDNNTPDMNRDDDDLEYD